jgi:hypothetical protein
MGRKARLFPLSRRAPLCHRVGCLDVALLALLVFGKERLYGLAP